MYFLGTAWEGEERWLFAILSNFRHMKHGVKYCGIKLKHKCKIAHVIAITLNKGKRSCQPCGAGIMLGSGVDLV